jgi:hypothetical protein
VQALGGKQTVSFLDLHAEKSTVELVGRYDAAADAHERIEDEIPPFVLARISLANSISGFCLLP